MKNVIVSVDACPMCNTPAYTTTVTNDLVLNSTWHECTSGSGLFGGGPCCAPLGHHILDEVDAGKRNIVIMNEQHSLLPEQMDLLYKTLGEYEIFSVPKAGWTVAEQRQLVTSRFGVPTETELNIVFVSPIPLMLALVACEIASKDETPYWADWLYLFVNDRREKKELPNGQVISVTARTGWELIKLP